jgi:hypothetical protein
MDRWQRARPLDDVRRPYSGGQLLVRRALGPRLGAPAAAHGGNTVNGRPWTNHQVRRLAVLWRNGVALEHVARALDRTPHAVQHKLGELGIRRSLERYSVTSEQAGNDARATLRAECAAARAERATAAPFKPGALEW